jgi:hypothetical protein
LLHFLHVWLRALSGNPGAAGGRVSWIFVTGFRKDALSLPLLGQQGRYVPFHVLNIRSDACQTGEELVSLQVEQAIGAQHPTLQQLHVASNGGQRGLQVSPDVIGERRRQDLGDIAGLARTPMACCTPSSSPPTTN